MIKMKYKDFEFPSNPAVVKTELSENINEKPVLWGAGVVFNMSHNAAKICCEGSFWGSERSISAQRLKILRSRGTPGWLFLPDGSCYYAFLSLLELRDDAKKNCISYSVSFIEAQGVKNGEYNFGFTYAQENENMFDISFRCSVPIEKLMQINHFENPFCVKNGDRVVLE